jgi:hypothetical protein
MSDFSKFFLGWATCPGKWVVLANYKPFINFLLWEKTFSFPNIKVTT